MELTTIVDNLWDGYKQLEPGAFLHVDEITAVRRTNLALRHESVYTADGAIFFMKCNTPMLAVTREAHNPILNHINDAYAKLLEDRKYPISQEEAEAAINAEDTEVFDLTKLNLTVGGRECSYLTMYTNIRGYNALNREERRLAECVYGRGTNFTRSMKIFRDANVHRIQIYIRNPRHVREEAANSPIAGASRVDDFYGDSSFNTLVYDVDMRGHLLALASI